MLPSALLFWLCIAVMSQLTLAFYSLFSRYLTVCGTATTHSPLLRHPSRHVANPPLPCADYIEPKHTGASARIPGKHACRVFVDFVLLCPYSSPPNVATLHKQDELHNYGAGRVESKKIQQPPRCKFYTEFSLWRGPRDKGAQSAMRPLALF